MSEVQPKIRLSKKELKRKKYETQQKPKIIDQLNDPENGGSVSMTIPVKGFEDLAAFMIADPDMKNTRVVVTSINFTVEILDDETDLELSSNTTQENGSS